MSITVPTDISGCQLWLDVNALVSTDGTSITTLPDGSGNSRDFTKRTQDQAAPVYKTNIINGNMPGLLFSNAAKSSLSNAWTPSGQMTIFVLAQLGNFSAGYGIFTSIKLFNPDGGFNLGNGGTGNKKLTIQTGLGGNWVDGANLASSDDLTAYPFMAEVVIGAGTTNLYNHNVIEGTDASHGSIAAGTVGTFLGALYRNDIPATDQWMDGYAFEIIVYDSALSDAVRGDVEEYLRAKWFRGALTTSLAAKATFTATDGTALSSYTPETGGQFVQHTDYGSGVASIDSGLVHNDNTGNTCAFYSPAVPFSADYEVCGDFVVKSQVGAAWLTLRMSTAAGDVTCYMIQLLFSGAASGWGLYKVIANSFTALTGPLLTMPLGRYTVRFVASGTSLKVYVNGALICNTTDSVITAKGRGGFELHQNTTTTGVHIDNFQMTGPGAGGLIYPRLMDGGTLPSGMTGGMRG